MNAHRAQASCSGIMLTVVILLSSCGGPEPSSRAPASPSPVTTGSPTPAVTLTPTIVPSQTPAPVTFLGDLTPVSATTGVGFLGVGVYNIPDDPSMNKKPIRSHGTKYAHGLFAHAPSILNYRLDGMYRLFTTKILAQDGGTCGDGQVFRIVLDGRVAYASTPVFFDTEPTAVQLDVGGVETLTLIVDMRQALDCDWAIWGDPFLTRQEAVARDFPTPTLPPVSTPDPNLPCGGVNSEKNYLFLDCGDIQRIRQGIEAGDPDQWSAWLHLLQVVNWYLANPATSYNPGDYQSVFFGWGGDYIPRDLALAYLVTGKTEYGAEIVRLLDLVKHNTPLVARMGPHPEFGGLAAKPSYGEIVYQSLLFGYLTVRDTPLVDERLREAYDTFFIRQAQLLEEWMNQAGDTSIDSPVNRNTRIGATVAAATIALGIPGESASRGLLERAKARLASQMRRWWEADGGWGEDTDQYGSRVLEGLLLYAEAQARIGDEDVYSMDFGGIKLRLLCDHFAEVVTPEGTSPALNDSGHVGVDPGLFRLCGYRTHDPQLEFAYEYYLWGLRNAYGRDNASGITLFHIIAWGGLGDTGVVEPGFTSVMLPATGAAILREDWSHDGQYMLLQFTGSRVHAEYSYGAVYLFDHGPWIVGNGYHLKGWAGHPGAPTDQHSTLGLDNRDQTETGGVLIAFADLAQTGIAAVMGRPYSNMQHVRTVLWNKSWHQWIVVDDVVVSDEQRHDLQLRWYVRGGYKQGSDELWSFDRGKDDSLLTVQMVPERSAMYSKIDRHYSGEEWISDAVGVQMDVVYRGGPARLVTSLTSSVSGAESPKVTRSEPNGATQIESELGRLTWTWILPEAFRNNVDMGENRLVGVAGCAIREYGQLRGYCLMNGKSLVMDGKTLADSASSLYIEADFTETKLFIQSETAGDASFYWPGEVTTILEGDSLLPFSVNDGLVSITFAAGGHVFDLR